MVCVSPVPAAGLRFFKRIVSVLGVMVALVAGAAAAEPVAGGELRFYAWADYIAPAVLAKFHRETGIRVTIIPVTTSPELTETLLAGATGFDLAVPSNHHVRRLARAGLIERIDVEALPGAANLQDAWRSPPYDPGNAFSLPWHWGTTGFVVDTTVYGGDIDTLSVLFDPPPALKGRMLFLAGAEEVIKMGLIWLGLPPCSAEPVALERALALVRTQLRPELIADISTVIDRLAHGPAAGGVAWNGDALRARELRPGLRYAYPREGVILWSDALVIPKGAPNRTAALAFLRFMLRPENAALQSNFTRYANAVRGSEAFLDQAIVTAPEVTVPASARIDFLQFCDSEVLRAQANAWETMLAGAREGR